MEGEKGSRGMRLERKREEINGSKNAAGSGRNTWTNPQLHPQQLSISIQTTITHIPLSTHAPTLDASRKTHVAAPSLPPSSSLSLFLALRNVVVALRIERTDAQYSNEIPAYTPRNHRAHCIIFTRHGPILESRVCINRGWYWSGSRLWP